MKIVEPRLDGAAIAVLKGCKQSIVDFIDAKKVATCMRLDSCQNDEDRRNLQSESKSWDVLKQSLIKELDRKT